MKRLIFLCALLFFVSIVFAGAVELENEQDMIVEVDLLGPPVSVVSIEVPDYIFFGNVSLGEELRTNKKIRVNNKGNVPVVVSTSLLSGAPTMFENLYFSLLVSSSRFHVNDFDFSINYSKTSTKYGEFYGWLNLTSYTEELPEGSILRRNATVKFFAVEDTS